MRTGGPGGESRKVPEGSYHLVSLSLGFGFMRTPCFPCPRQYLSLLAQAVFQAFLQGRGSGWQCQSGRAGVLVLLCTGDSSVSTSWAS